jgi:hypothetical protein
VFTRLPNPDVFASQALAESRADVRAAIADLRAARLAQQRAENAGYRGGAAIAQASAAAAAAEQRLRDVRRRYTGWKGQQGELETPRQPRELLPKMVAVLRRTPVARRPELFQRWAGVMERRTGGGWFARPVPTCTGAACFAGRVGGALVFDPGGAMYRGNINDRSQFALTPRGYAPVYANLRRL